MTALVWISRSQYTLQQQIVGSVELSMGIKQHQGLLSHVCQQQGKDPLKCFFHPRPVSHSVGRKRSISFSSGETPNIFSRGVPGVLEELRTG